MALIVDLEGKFGCFYHSVLRHPQVWINSRQPALAAMQFTGFYHAFAN